MMWLKMTGVVWICGIQADSHDKVPRDQWRKMAEVCVMYFLCLLVQYYHERVIMVYWCFTIHWYLDVLGVCMGLQSDGDGVVKIGYRSYNTRGQPPNTQGILLMFIYVPSCLWQALRLKDNPSAGQPTFRYRVKPLTKSRPSSCRFPPGIIDGRYARQRCFSLHGRLGADPGWTIGLPRFGGHVDLGSWDVQTSEIFSCVRHVLVQPCHLEQWIVTQKTNIQESCIL